MVIAASAHAPRILILQGHPDTGARHFGHALADAYAQGAQRAGHLVRRVEVAALDFPLLRSQAAWERQPLPVTLLPAQEALQWATHLVVFFPLWLGGMPALLKGFLEQITRPGAEVPGALAGGMPRKLLAGRSARIVVTMGMPALIYRWYFRAHSVKALERSVLGVIGVAPVHETLVGSIEGMTDAQRRQWLVKLESLGGRAL